jgi:Flp pilus assembly protein TadG
MKLLKRLRVLCCANHGSALVELALITPALTLLLVGAVDFGRAGYVGIEVQNAAHAGAEYGSLNPSDTAGMTTAAQQGAHNLSNLTVSTPTWGCECSDGSSYSANCSPTPVCTADSTRGSNVVHRVQVKTKAVYSPMVSWPGISSSSITFTGEATLRGN